MIDLLASDDLSGFGVAAALAIEGIPCRRIARAEDFDARLLVVADSAATPATAALAARVPTLAIGAPPALARELFGVRGGQTCEGPTTIALADEIWPASVRAQAHHFGKDTLRLPRAPVFAADTPPAGTVLAHLRCGGSRLAPTIVRRGALLWCPLDLGAAFAHLLGETYAPPGPSPRALPALGLALYYHAPDVLRRIFQRATYARLARSLAGDAAASEYPIEAAGWLLLELLKALVRSVAGGLVRLARWPAPYSAAAALTHDLEPTRFAYRRGLEILIRHATASAHPATVGVVAGPAARHLDANGAGWIARQDVLCHGLEHRGETLLGTRADVAAGLIAARQGLEERLGRRVEGFRSPRLDRSPDLLRALDEVGFRFDSSYPDVDRENASRFGQGVRLQVPFRPPLPAGDGHVRPSRCLELPVSAPDCIQPLFQGEGVRGLRHAVRAKVDFVTATGGLYVGIVHGGVFGRRDAARRGEHLRFVAGLLERPGLWRTTPSAIAAWWEARESVALGVRGGRAVVTNHGERTLAGLSLLIEHEDGERSVALPPLAPAGSALVALERGESQRTASGPGAGR